MRAVAVRHGFSARLAAGASQLSLLVDGSDDRRAPLLQLPEVAQALFERA
jgi:hypothetical protein